MQTITFYSYKGGVGRTLVVANVAKYLAQFGQRVFALDFDIEAPGLHYKLALDGEPNGGMIRRGVVDYIYDFAVAGDRPGTLANHVIEIAQRDEHKGKIYVMPAGNVPSAPYWRKLAQINWHDLFYSKSAKGIPFFLELKGRIEAEFAPDFLLIDSRTGITEIGGVATTLLPDKVVSLMLYNRENLEGVREVLRGIKRTPRLPNQDAIEIIPVVTRIPKMEHSTEEEHIIREVRSFLNESAPEPLDTLEIPELFILHSEPELQVSETLRVGGKKTFEESLLLRDYMRLFARIIPKNIIEPHIGVLVADATRRAFDDPEGAGRLLEALAASYPHPEAYRALIKFYRLRRVEDATILRAASRFWELTDAATEPMLWEVVKDHFKPVMRYGDRPVSLEFVEAIWRGAGASDIEVGLRIAESYSILSQDLRASHVLRGLVEKVNPPGNVVAAYIGALRRLKDWELVEEVVTKFKNLLSEDPHFLAAWANTIVDKKHSVEAQEFLEMEDVKLTKIKEQSPIIHARLLMTANRMSEADGFLQQILRAALMRGPSQELDHLGELFRELGKWREFEERVKEAFGSDNAREFLSRRARRWRY